MGAAVESGGMRHSIAATASTKSKMRLYNPNLSKEVVVHEIKPVATDQTTNIFCVVAVVCAYPNGAWGQRSLKLSVNARILVQILCSCLPGYAPRRAPRDVAERHSPHGHY